MFKQKIDSIFSKRLFLVACGLLVLGLILFTLEKTGITDFYTKKGPVSQQEAKTTSTTATAQESFSEGESREPGNSVRENEGDGNISDSNGDVGSVDTSNPIVSSTGEITVFSPQKNQVISGSYKIAGASTLGSVSYRLIDSVSGVIAMGDLQVINGKFAGDLTVSTAAKEGRLDIYGTKQDGSEFSNVEIPLRFSQ